MNNIQIFNNDEFGEIRTVIKDDEPMFCLADVCKALEINNVSQLKTRLKEDGVITNEVGVQTGIKSDGTPAIQMIKMNFINEANLYKTIFQSRKESADRFTDWVTSEVLPSIRKHGAYMTEQTLEQALTSPDFLIKLATQLKEEKDKNKALEAENAQLAVDKQIMQPKADYFDELVDRNLLTNFRETAKQLDIPPKKFVAFLVDKKYVYRDKRGKLLPYEDKNKGLFEVKETFNEKTQWSGTQTLITPKGRETFRLLYLNSIA